MTSLVINVIELQLSLKKHDEYQILHFSQNPECARPVFFSHSHTGFFKCGKRNKMFVLIKAPQVVLETMSSLEEAMADSNTIYSTGNVSSSYIPAASGFFIHGSAMNGAFRGLHH